jgi:hypothetical protein
MFATRSQLARWLDLSLIEIDEIYLDNPMYKITHPCSGGDYAVRFT